MIETALIGQGALEPYLEGVLGGSVRVAALHPLGGKEAAADPKGFGYGEPFEVECVAGGVTRRLVVARTRPAQGFGHDYPADRAWQAIYAHEAYNSFPRHARSLDVGFVAASGQLVSARDAVEYFQVVEKVDGCLYWLDLDRLLHAPARQLDHERAMALGAFLASAHAVKHHEPTLYQRRIRELVGHGECLMGILDSYPHPYALLPAGDCEALERAAVSWRWKLRDRAHRLSRVHGDFHPWNLLFEDGLEFSVLDRSRGEWGEPADDVAALGINYLFYGLLKSDGREVAEPFLSLFGRFLSVYLASSGDSEILEVLPPFLMFRAVVIAHPRWYPDLTEPTRRALLDFARTMAEADAFDPERVKAELGSVT
jgi:Ser/Thr protein kinase RdoA (MazF antagonist)